jgi:hypothetical protein
MPKTRGRQHHRQRGSRPDHLQLPQTFMRFGPYFPFQNVVYPEGWTSEPFPTKRLALFYLRITAIFLAAIFLVTLVIYLLGGR